MIRYCGHVEDKVATHVGESGKTTQKLASHFPSYSEVGLTHIGPAVACLVHMTLTHSVREAYIWLSAQGDHLAQRFHLQTTNLRHRSDVIFPKTLSYRGIIIRHPSVLCHSST